MVRRHSLGWLLPTYISGMLLAVLLTLTWWAYSELSQSLRQAAHDRLQIVSAQIAQSLQGSVARAKRDAQAQADRQSVRSFMSRPNPGTLEDTRADLAEEGFEGIGAIEILDARGRRVLGVGPDADRVIDQARKLITRDSSSETSAVGAFYALDDTTVVSPAIALITNGDERLGYLIKWSIVSRNHAERDLISRLLGSGGRLLLGGTTGVWHDMVRVAPAPHPVATDAGIVTYDDGRGNHIAVKNAVPGSPWLMLVEFPEAAVLEPARTFRDRLLRVAALLIVLSFFGVRMISRRITRPLQNLTSASEAISSGDYSRRADATGVDEVTRLASAFNQMADRIQSTYTDLDKKVDELRSTREQFVRAQRMEAVGQLAGGVAHDFNNLLTVILAECAFAKDEPDAEARNASIAEITSAGERAASLTRQLLAFSRRQLFAPTVFNVPKLVKDMERMMTRLVGENVRVTAEGGSADSNVRADKAQIEQVLVNLIVNARDAMPEGGSISINVEHVTVSESDTTSGEEPAPGEYIVISVADTGTGFSEDALLHAFEPFYTTKENGRGSGLGLATSYGIVKQSGGHITVSSEPGSGTTLRVFLPRVHEATTIVSAQTIDRPRGTETILLVEDEVAVRNVAARILAGHGYEVLEADSGEAALPILEMHIGKIQLLLTDVMLTGMGGRAVAEKAVALRPDIRILFMSGYTDDVVLKQNLTVRDAALIEKPFTIDTLMRGVRDALAEQRPVTA